MTQDNLTMLGQCQYLTMSQVWGNDYITGSLLDYPYFKESYMLMLIAINLRNQKPFNAYPKAIQQISFTGNLDYASNTTTFFIIEEIIDFTKRNLKVL